MANIFLSTCDDSNLRNLLLNRVRPKANIIRPKWFLCRWGGMLNRTIFNPHLELQKLSCGQFCFIIDMRSIAFQNHGIIMRIIRGRSVRELMRGRVEAFGIMLNYFTFSDNLGTLFEPRALAFHSILICNCHYCELIWGWDFQLAST